MQLSCWTSAVLHVVCNPTANSFKVNISTPVSLKNWYLYLTKEHQPHTNTCHTQKMCRKLYNYMFEAFHLNWSRNNTTASSSKGNCLTVGRSAIHHWEFWIIVLLMLSCTMLLQQRINKCNHWTTKIVGNKLSLERFLDYNWLLTQSNCSIMK